MIAFVLYHFQICHFLCIGYLKYNKESQLSKPVYPRVYQMTDKGNGHTG